MPELSTLLQDLADDLVQDRADRRAGLGVGVDDVAHRVSTRRRRRERRRLMGVAAALMVIVGAGVVVAARRDDSSQVVAVASSGPPVVAPTSSPRGRELQSALDGRAFLARTATENGEPRPLAENTYLRLVFSGGTAGGSAGCNGVGGPVAFEETTLVLDESFSTQNKLCPGPIDQQEKWFTSLLRDRPVFMLDGDWLTLTRGPYQVRFVDSRIADRVLRLIDRNWRLDTFTTAIATGTTNLASSSPSGTASKPFLGFDLAGNATFATGCTAGGARYTWIDGEMTFGAVHLNPRTEACSPEAEAMEREVLTVLTGTVRVELGDNTLVLSKGDQSMRYVAS